MLLFELFAKIGIDSSEFDNGLKNAKTKLSAFGKFATKAGKKLAPLSAGVAAIGTAMVKTAMDFDAEMSKVSAISGATGEEFDKLREKAIEMGDKTIFSASESAQAMEYMAMAGWKTEDMLEGIDGIMNLAAASGEDLATASDIVTDALTAFGQSADEAGRLADIMAAASSNANTNVHLMGETFKYVAPLAGSMGYEMEDTAVAIGLMANAGVKGSQAGTALRSILTRLAKPTKESAAAMDALGISLEDSEGNMLSFREVMDQMRYAFHNKLMIPEEEFQESLKELNDKLEEGTIKQKEYDKELEVLTQRAYGAEGATMAQYAAMLGGQEAMSGLLAIVNAAPEDYEKLTNAIYGSEGAAEDMAKTMNENLAGQLKILKSNIDTLSISIGELMVPTITKVVEKLQQFVQWLNSLDNSTKTVIVTVGGIAAVLSPLLIILGSVAKVIGAIIDLFIKIGTIIPAVTASFAAIKASAAGLWAVLAANPIGLIITAIALVTTAMIVLWNKSEGFRKFVTNFGNAVIRLVSDVASWIAQTFQETWDNITYIWERLPAFFSNVWLRIKNAFSNVKDFFAQKFYNALTAVKATWDSAAGYFSNVWENIKSSFFGVIEWFSNIFGEAKQAIINAFTFDWASIGRNIMDGIRNGINGAIEGAKNAAINGSKAIANGVKSFFEIASPSKLMERFGKHIDGGLALGIERNVSDPVRSMERLSNRVSGAFSGNVAVGNISAGGYTGKSGAGAVLDMINSNSAGRTLAGNTPVNLTLVLELDRMQTAKAVYNLNNEETARIGLKLAGGVV